jgi:hypothetical protein
MLPRMPAANSATVASPMGLGAVAVAVMGSSWLLSSHPGATLSSPSQ